MKQALQIIQEVDAIYHWLDEQLSDLKQSCNACGDCCDFESFGHKLYVTTPELIYFHYHHGSDIKEMSTGVCPYRMDGKCTVYPYRFSACRIFSCKGDTEKENALCEQTLRRFKLLCSKSQLDYHYVSLRTGLKMIQEDKFKIEN